MPKHAGICRFCRKKAWRASPQVRGGVALHAHHTRSQHPKPDKTGQNRTAAKKYGILLMPNPTKPDSRYKFGVPRMKNPTKPDTLVGFDGQPLALLHPKM